MSLFYSIPQLPISLIFSFALPTLRFRQVMGITVQDGLLHHANGSIQVGR